MDEKRIDTTPHRDNETHILGRIVDAMLAAETDLRDATVEEWTHTLVESCRQQKRRYADRGMSVASSC
jgi:hypothetical protein